MRMWIQKCIMINAICVLYNFPMGLIPCSIHSLITSFIPSFIPSYKCEQYIYMHLDLYLNIHTYIQRNSAHISTSGNRWNIGSGRWKSRAAAELQPRISHWVTIRPNPGEKHLCTPCLAINQGGFIGDACSSPILLMACWKLPNLRLNTVCFVFVASSSRLYSHHKWLSYCCCGRWISKWPKDRQLQESASIGQYIPPNAVKMCSPLFWPLASTHQRPCSRLEVLKWDPHKDSE